MDYVTNYYKNLSEQLQNKVDRLSSQLKMLNEDDWWRDPQFNAPVPQERGVDPARGIIPSIDDVNPPKPNQKRQAAPPPTRNPKPKKPELEKEPGNPEEEWAKNFNRDEWYQIWKTMWEQMYVKNREKAMNDEFERMLKEMYDAYLVGRGRGGRNLPPYEAWQKVLQTFYRYFLNPPTVA